MEKTPFAGLTILEPGEGLDTDNGAFIDRDRRTIDQFLQLGAKLHRHNGAAGLSNPLVPASAAVVASAGAIQSDLTISLGYTLEDAQGGETMLAPLAVVSTGPPMDIPPAAPSAAVDYTAGSLQVDSYYYAVTWADGEGGETPAGPAAFAERAPGFASGRVVLTNLSYGMAAAGAVGWRLFRAIGGGTYDLLATGGAAEDEFVDDGTSAVDCDSHPPTDSQNTTRQINSLLVTLPTAPSGAVGINLYGSQTGDFGEASSLGQFPIASGGQTAVFRALNFTDATPPDVNTSVGGASLIDPDTELLDWHWKRPVAASAELGSGARGDVRLVEDGGRLYAVLGASAGKAVAWTRIASAAAVSPLAASAASLKVANVEEIDFFASGGVTLGLKETAPGRALVTIGLASGIGAGGSGSVGPQGPPGPTKLTEGASAVEWYEGSTKREEVKGFKIGAKHTLRLAALTSNQPSFEVTSEEGGAEDQHYIRAVAGLHDKKLITASGTSDFMQLANIGRVKYHGLVTKLPSGIGVVNVGDTCDFYADEANGVIWHLIYDGKGSYPWKKIGGPAIRQEIPEATGVFSANSYSTVKMPLFAAPLKMVGRVIFGAGLMQSQSVELNQIELQAFKGASALGVPSIFIGASIFTGAPGIGNAEGEIAKAENVYLAYKTLSSKSSQIYWPWLELDPVRVG